MMMFVATVLLLTAPCMASYYEYEADERAELLWIPDELELVRGIVVWGNGAGGDDRAAAERPSLQGFAQLNDFALLATARWERFEGDEIELWEAHLQALAELSGHPELVHAPWAPLGFSNGGQMSYGLNAVRPEKVIGMVANKGGFYNDHEPPEAALLTPGLLIAGEEDEDYRRQAIRTIFEDNRARGARWAWVEQQAAAHEDLAERIMLPFMDRCVQLRYPADQSPSAHAGVSLRSLEEESGWLADVESWEEPLAQISAWKDYPGERDQASWLLGEDEAWHYRAFATRADWLELGPGGAVTGRPLHILRPAFDAFMHDEPCQDLCTISVELDTSEQADFLWLGVYTGSELLAELVGKKQPQDNVKLEVDLPGGGVWGLSALAHCADGVTRTSGLRHVVVLGERPPEPQDEADSGLDTGVDGGQDSGAEAGEDEALSIAPGGGCGCRAKGGSGLLVLLPALWLAGGRRRPLRPADPRSCSPACSG